MASCRRRLRTVVVAAVLIAKIALPDPVPGVNEEEVAVRGGNGCLTINSVDRHCEASPLGAPRGGGVGSGSSGGKSAAGIRNSYRAAVHAGLTAARRSMSRSVLLSVARKPSCSRSWLAQSSSEREPARPQGGRAGQVKRGHGWSEARTSEARLRDFWVLQCVYGRQRSG